MCCFSLSFSLAPIEGNKNGMPRGSRGRSPVTDEHRGPAAEIANFFRVQSAGECSTLGRILRIAADALPASDSLDPSPSSPAAGPLDLRGRLVSWDSLGRRLVRPSFLAPLARPRLHLSGAKQGQGLWRGRAAGFAWFYGISSGALPFLAGPCVVFLVAGNLSILPQAQLAPPISSGAFRVLRDGTGPR